MQYRKAIPANIVEPELMAEWRRLNKDIFDNQLKLEPTSLIWHSDIRKLGGMCQYPKNGTAEVRIAIKVTLKDNYQAWRLTLAHEMIHQLLYETWFNVPELNRYEMSAFVNDESPAFMLEIHRISQKLGCSYKELQYWRTKDENPELKTQTQRQYIRAKELEEEGRATLEELF